MNKPRTYNELLAEKARLKLLVKEQQQLIHEDFNELKQELEPVRKVINNVKKLFSKEAGGGLLTLGADKLIDVLLRNVLLARSGWIAKLILPTLAKNFTSHIVDDNKGKIVSWLVSFFKNRKKSDSNTGEHGEVAVEK